MTVPICAMDALTDFVVDLAAKCEPAGLLSEDSIRAIDEQLQAAFAEVRAEALADAKREVVAWLVKKAAEGNDPIESLASKVDRGAVRIFLGTGHYRDAMDAHRAEATAEALHNAADSASVIHQNCHRNPEVCAGCQVRADILDVLRSVADVIAPKAGERR